MKRYSPKQLSFLRTGYRKMMAPALTAAFNQSFRASASPIAIKSALSNHGFLCGRKPGFPVGTLLAWTKQEASFIKRECKRFSVIDLTVVFNKHFHSSKKATQIKAFMGNNRIRSGRNCCFEKGHMPWNLGTKGLGICKPNSGNFKKGHAPANLKPIGHERIDSKDGYILIKVKERNPYSGAPTRYRQKHVVLWEKKHGSVPKGSVIMFMDGNKRNLKNDNLVCITKNELCRLNKLGYPYYSAKVKPSVFALIKLKVKTRELVKNKH